MKKEFLVDEDCQNGRMPKEIGNFIIMYLNNKNYGRLQD